jgi:hypothetical protein
MRRAAAAAILRRAMGGAPLQFLRRAWRQEHGRHRCCLGLAAAKSSRKDTKTHQQTQVTCIKRRNSSNTTNQV